MKGAHGDETLFPGVAEQGLGEDLDLVAVGFTVRLDGCNPWRKMEGAGSRPAPCILKFKTESRRLSRRSRLPARLAVP